MAPIEHGSSTEFLPIVGADHLGQAACVAQLVQYPGQHVSADGPLRRDSYAFMRGIIDHRQTLDYPIFRTAVKYKVHRPHLIRFLALALI
jgi:hypothetical protein